MKQSYTRFTMKKGLRFLVFACMLFGSVFYSCKKPAVDTETASSTDNAVAEAEFTAVVPSTNSRAVSTKGISGSKLASANGPYIYIDSAIAGSLWPRRIWFDFDRDATGSPLPSGTLDIDGRTRKGRLSMLLSSAWVSFYPSKLKIDSFVNYSSNGAAYSADSIVISKNDSVLTCTVNNGICVYSGATLKWSCQRTFTFFNSGKLNEFVQVTGSANGVSSANLSYTSVIRTALIKYKTCPWICSGTVAISPSGLSQRIIDYSVNSGGAHTGDCDNYVSLTMNGSTFIFQTD